MFKLIVVHPFKGFVKGQVISDQAEVGKHLVDREHHFVRVPMSKDEEEMELLRQKKAAEVVAAADSTFPKDDPVADVAAKGK